MQESGEMYLETILVISREKPNVRSIDIANHMGYSKPSVSRAVNLLKNEGYIDIDEHGSITLRAPGRKVAETIYERHVVLAELLMRIGVDEVTASVDACKIEHDISDVTFEAIKKHMTNNS